MSDPQFERDRYPEARLLTTHLGLVVITSYTAPDKE